MNISLGFHALFTLFITFFLIYGISDLEYIVLYISCGISDLEKIFLYWYLDGLLLYASQWALLHRVGLLIRGHNTNNSSEATMCIIKDVVLRR